MPYNITKNELYSLIPILPNLTDIVREYIGNPFTFVVGVHQIMRIPHISPKTVCFVDWGDGCIDNITCFKSDVKHSYKESRTYIISVYGKIKDIFLGYTNQLLEILHWGDIKPTSCNHMFNECKNLVSISAQDQLDLRSVKDIQYMFYGCIMLTHANISNWHVENISNMSGMFMKCEWLNVDVSKWNVSNVKNMSRMFENCFKFNCDLGEWNVKNVTDMSNMFSNCHNFNSDISKWNIENVKTTHYMFKNCEKFDSDLSKWNVSNVNDMSYMFYGCKKFNSDLSLRLPSE